MQQPLSHHHPIVAEFQRRQRELQEWQLKDHAQYFIIHDHWEPLAQLLLCQDYENKVSNQELMNHAFIHCVKNNRYAMLQQLLQDNGWPCTVNIRTPGIEGYHDEALFIAYDNDNVETLSFLLGQPTYQQMDTQAFHAIMENCFKRAANTETDSVQSFAYLYERLPSSIVQAWLEHVFEDAIGYGCLRIWQYLAQKEVFSSLENCQRSMEFGISLACVTGKEQCIVPVLAQARELNIMLQIDFDNVFPDAFYSFNPAMVKTLIVDCQMPLTPEIEAFLESLQSSLPAPVKLCRDLFQASHLMDNLDDKETIRKNKL